MDGPVLVVVVGADRLARAGIVGLLSGEPLVEVLGDASPGAAVALLERTAPDVVVWDAAEADPALRDLPTVALVRDPDGATVALASGASAVVRRETDAPDLAAAVRAVHHGFIVVDRTLAAAVLRDPPVAPVGPGPTGREREVLELLALGFSNREIAAQLGISAHTAKFHVRSLLEKLGATTRTEVVVLAARQGWLVL